MMCSSISATSGTDCRVQVQVLTFSLPMYLYSNRLKFFFADCNQEVYSCFPSKSGTVLFMSHLLCTSSCISQTSSLSLLELINNAIQGHVSIHKSCSGCASINRFPVIVDELGLLQLLSTVWCLIILAIMPDETVFMS